MKHKKTTKNNNTTYLVSVVSRNGPYTSTSCFRLTLSEIKERFIHWILDEHQIISISINFEDGKRITDKAYTELNTFLKQIDS